MLDSVIYLPTSIETTTMKDALSPKHRGKQRADDAAG